MANLYGKYTFEILDINNHLLADISSFAKKRALKFVRNNTYTASFDLDLHAFEKYCRAIDVLPNSILGVGQNVLRVKRLDTVMYTGLIDSLTASVEERSSIKVRSVNWLELFRYRFTAALVQHTNKTYGQIMWDTIDTSQLQDYGSWGVTRGVDQTTALRDKKHEYKNVKDALTDITKLDDGPDFEFSSSRVFNVFTEMGVTKTEFEFTFPGNIKSISVDRTSKDIANYLLVRGQGIGDAQLKTTVEDAGSKANYHLRQQILDKSDVSELTTLTKHGNEYLATHSDPLEIVNITLDGNKSPFVGSYWIGDRVPMLVNDLQIFDINGLYRIDEMNIDLGDGDDEEIGVKLSLWA